MKRVNKHLIIFVSLFFLLGGSLLVSLQKIFPLASNAVYYCQTVMNSLSLPIPPYIGLTPLLLVFVFIVAAAIKLVIICMKIQKSRKQMLRNLKKSKKLHIILSKLRIEDKTYLIKSKKRFAFCLGIRSPKIYISTALIDILNAKEIEAVLLHERYHLKKRDTLTILVASTGESLLPFFPLISDLLRNYRVEREINADQEAILRLGDKKPLISVLKKLLATPQVATVTASAIADQDTLEPRIHALLKKSIHQRKFKVKHIIISLFSLIGMSVITLAPVEAFEISHQGENMIMICPNGNECAATCREKYESSEVNYSENKLYSPSSQ